MFKVTGQAAAQFKAILAGEDKPEAYIRIYISGFG